MTYLAAAFETSAGHMESHGEAAMSHRIAGTRKLTEEGARRHIQVTRAVLGGATFKHAGGIIGVGKSSAYAMYMATLRRARAFSDDAATYVICTPVEKHRKNRVAWWAAIDALEKEWFK